jgi:hypothetical protein
MAQHVPPHRLVRVGQTVRPPPGRNRLRAIREIGRENGSVFWWAVIDTDPRNADDLSIFQLPESGTVRDRLPVAMSLPPFT